MRTRRTWVDILGPLFGLLAAGLTIYALVHLLWIRPFFREGSYRAARAPAGLFAAGAGWESREATEAVEGDFSRLEIKNVSGPIRIEGWSRDFVQVYYQKQARSSRYLDEFEIAIAPRGNTLSIRPLYRTIPGSPFGSVTFELKIPATLKEITAGNVSGGIELRNLGSDIDQVLETVSGRISTERAGDLKARSVSGAIDFVFSGRTLNLNTTSGGIRGKIQALPPGAAVDIHSISGGVDLEAFHGLDASLDLQSVSGSISCDFPVRIVEQKRNKLEGTVGSGAVPFSVRTVSGGIRLRR